MLKVDLKECTRFCPGSVLSLTTSDTTVLTRLINLGKSNTEYGVMFRNCDGYYSVRIWRYVQGSGFTSPATLAKELNVTGYEDLS